MKTFDFLPNVPQDVMHNSLEILNCRAVRKHQPAVEIQYPCGEFHYYWGNTLCDITEIVKAFTAVYVPYNTTINVILYTDRDNADIEPVYCKVKKTWAGNLKWNFTKTL